MRAVGFNARVEQFKTAAKKAGLKLTHQRLEILREIAAREDHPDAETLHRALQPRMPTISLDTVYRTLGLLTDLGLITTLGPRRESTRFDANLKQHHHYVCTRCGLVRDFESTELNALQIPDAVRQFGEIVTSHVEVRGICAACSPESSGGSRRQARRSMRKSEGSKR